MKAVTYHRYGTPDVLNLVDLPKPTPGPGDLLIRVHASSVTSGDVRMRAFDVPAPFRIPARFMLGYPTPKNPILGYEFAGIVEAVGTGVTRFSPGDRVYGGSGGNYAEYRTIAEKGPVAIMPKGLSYKDAASLPFGALTALHFVRAAGIGPDQKVLVIGASGCVGAYTTQLASHLGASVTGVCSSRNADFVRAQGADQVIDYETADYMRSGAYDVVMDAVGASSFGLLKPLIKRGGVFLNIVMSTPDMLALMNPFKDGRRIVSGSFDTTQAMLLALNDLVAEGAFRPLIDRTYPLEKIREAHGYVDSKRKRGTVVVTI